MRPCHCAGGSQWAGLLRYFVRCSRIHRGNIGLRGLGPTRAVAYTYAISPLAVLMGAAVLDEELSLWLAFGAVLVVGGVALARHTRGQGRSASVGRWPSASSRSET